MKLGDVLGLVLIAAVVGAIFLGRRKANAGVAKALSAAFAAGEAHAQASAAAVSSSRVELGGIHLGGDGQRIYARGHDDDRSGHDLDGTGADYLGSADGRGLSGSIDSGVPTSRLRAIEADGRDAGVADPAVVRAGDAGMHLAHAMGAAGLNICPYCGVKMPSKAKLVTHCHLSHSEMVVGDPAERSFFEMEA